MKYAKNITKMFFLGTLLFLISCQSYKTHQITSIAKPDDPKPFYYGTFLDFPHQIEIGKHPLHEHAFIQAQAKIIQQHIDLLVAGGRITDPDHFDGDIYLATYGWYDGICDDESGLTNSVGTVGTNACSFGTYAFSETAYEQAKRIFVIHGTVDAGTDILVDESYQQAIPDKDGAIWYDSDGGGSPIGKGAFDPSLVGYTVGSLTYCESYGNHDKYCEEPDLPPSKVVKFIDGGHVKIDHIAKHDAQMYGLMIVPPNFVDMCNCFIPATPPDTSTKPCVQGGSLLGPGESCSM